MKRETKLPNGNILRAHALLRAIGQQEPYFSLQGEELNPRRRGNQVVCCGCMHNDLVKKWPDLAPLARIHLSHQDGVPMYAVENGWYWLEGVAGGFGSEFHGASGAGAKSREECLAILSDHFRITLDEARDLVEQIRNVPARQYGADDFGVRRNNRQHKAALAAWVEARRPIWKLEAEQLIARFGLEVER